MPVPVITSAALAAGSAALGTAFGYSTTAYLAQAHFHQQAHNEYFSRYPNEQSFGNWKYDAFLHAYTSARMSQLIGKDMTLLYGNTMRENFQDLVGADTEQVEMDKYNNYQSADIYETHPPVSAFTIDTDLATDILGRIDTGNGTGDFFGKNPYENTVPSIPDDPEPTEEALDDIGEEASGDDVGGDPNEPPLPPIPPRKPPPDGDGGLLDHWLDGARDLWRDIHDFISPLVVDMDGDGIELVSLANATHYFDLDVDGFGEATGWVAADDALLAIDLNSDGIINDNSELFGSDTTDGFTILSDYDSNGDNVIDSNDTQWGELLVWQDSNQNGYSETGELYTLDYAGIQSISLAAVVEVDYFLEGNHITHESTFVLDNGSGPVTRDIVDAWFAIDDFNSHSISDVDFDIRIAFLPVLRGFGELADLHIAMSDDNVGPDSLLEQVKDLKYTGFSDLFTNTVDQAVTSILYRWGDVDPALSWDARGQWLTDAKHLEFLEEFFGESFLQRDYWDDPRPNAAREIEDLWDVIYGNLKAQLLLQSGAGSLFANELTYNLTEGQIIGTYELSQDGITALKDGALALAQGDREAFWENVAHFMKYSKGDVTDPTELGWLDQAVADSLTPNLSTWSDAVALLDEAGGLDIQGDSSDNTLTGATLNDTLDGLDGNDTLEGLGGHDTLRGGAGNDILDGGVGGDTLEGGAGDDTYVYLAGADAIDDSSSVSGDTIRIDDNTIGLADLTFVRTAEDDLIITIGTIGEISIVQHFNHPDNQVETLTFTKTGETALDLSALNDVLTEGSVKGDIIFGVNNSGNLNDTIYGYAGNDSVHGQAGNDALYGGDDHDSLDGGADNDMVYGEAGNDTLDGGTGVDELYGGEGNDTLDGGDGNDTLYGDTGDDILRGKNDSDIIYGGDGNDILEGGDHADELYGGAGNDTITGAQGDEIIEGNDGDDTIDAGIDNDTVYGGAGHDIIDAGSGTDTVYGGTGNDIITGDSGIDTLYGDDGDDVIDAGRGDDIVYGGLGNDRIIGGDEWDTLYGGDGDDYLQGDNRDDTLEGGAGSDTYFWESTNDADTITDSDGVRDTISLGSALRPEDIVFTETGTNDLDVTFSTMSGKLSIMGHRDGLGTQQVERVRFDDGSELDLVRYADWSFGTSSNNTMNGTSSDEIYIGLAGNDTLRGYAGTDILLGGVGNDYLYGGTGTDEVFGGDGDDRLYGENDNDILVGGLGRDTIYGGNHDDIIYDLTPEDAAVLDPFLDTNKTETLSGGAGNDLIIVQARNNNVYGGMGDDTFKVYFHADGTTGSTNRLYETSGVDTLVLANLAYSDTRWSLTHSNAEDFKFSYEGTSTTSIINLYAQFADYLPDGSPDFAINTIIFSDGVSINFSDMFHIIGTTATETLNGTTGDDYIATSSGGDTVHADAGDDYVRGGMDADILNGGAGNDLLSGLNGNDIIHGDEGDDRIYGEDDHDTLYGDAGVDVIYGQNGGDTIYGGTENDTLYGGNDMDTIYGDEGNDTVKGDAGDDTLYGDGDGSETYQGGNDIVQGGSGNDTIYGGAGNDSLSGYQDNDTIYGGDGNDNIFGEYGGAPAAWVGNDTLYGEAGDDYIKGGSGDDIISGGAGRDDLWGEAGADTFVFDVAPVANDYDDIFDFSTADGDAVDISAILTGYDPVTDSITDFVELTDNGTHTTLSVDTDGGADNFVATLRFLNVTGLNAETLETNGNLIAA